MALEFEQAIGSVKMHRGGLWIGLQGPTNPTFPKACSFCGKRCSKPPVDRHERFERGSIRYSPDGSICARFLAVLGPFWQQCSPAMTPLGSESRRLSCLAAREPGHLPWSRRTSPLISSVWCTGISWCLPPPQVSTERGSRYLAAQPDREFPPRLGSCMPSGPVSMPAFLREQCNRSKNTSPWHCQVLCCIHD
jgi:hypothetical protein